MTYVILVLMCGESIQTKKKFISTCIIMAMLGLIVTAPLGSVAAADPSSLGITNLSGASINLSYAQLLEMPKTVVNADLFCDGGLVTYGDWGGITLSYLLTQAQVTPEVSSIQFVATDGYGVAIPIGLAMQPQLIVAYEKNDMPLAEGLRLIVPGANGAVWISGIASITMSTSGADYPQSVAVGGGTLANLITSQSNTTRESPSQQQALQPQPTTPENSSGIQVTSHPNATDVYLPSAKPQSPNQSLNLQALLMYSIALASTMLIAIAIVAYVRKKKWAFARVFDWLISTIEKRRANKAS